MENKKRAIHLILGVSHAEEDFLILTHLFCFYYAKDNQHKVYPDIWIQRIYTSVQKINSQYI